MKNKYKFFALLGLLPFLAQAQLTNNGATIVIESGATLVVEGDIENNLTGDIQNSGTIQVKGNFTNAATADLTSSAGSIVEFIGDTEQLVTSNGDAFADVIMSTVSGTNVKLVDNMNIDGNLSFTTNGLIDIDGNDLTFGENATVDATNAPGAGRYIKADDGVGSVVRNFDVSSTFSYPIGGTDYSPLAVDVGSAEASAKVMVSVTESAVPSLPADAIDHIERYWDVSQTGFASFSASLDGTYVASDIATGGSDVNNMKGASYNETTTEWSYENASASPLVASGDIDADVQFTGSNTFARQPIKVFLAGPLSGTSMSTALNAAGLIPTTSPYDATSAASIPANAVDWILVELRDDANSSTVNDSYSKFLLSDGSVANIDGSTPVTFRDVTDVNTFVAVNHRNHLGVMTAANMTLGSLVNLDFTDLATSTFGTNAQYNNGANTAMWAGDANNDGNVLFFNKFIPPFTTIIGDTDVILGTLGGGTSSELVGYYNSDVNMDASVLFFNKFIPPFTTIIGDTDVVLGMLNGVTTGEINQNF